MKPEIQAHVDEWVAALRSGEYKQIDGTLRLAADLEGGSYGYCCLGVACDIYAKHHDDAHWDGGMFHIHNEREECDDAQLPDSVAEWFGLDDVEGTYHFTDQEGVDWQWSLIKHNDNDHDSFDRIADVIEAQVDGLFRMDVLV